MQAQELERYEAVDLNGVASIVVLLRRRDFLVSHSRHDPDTHAPLVVATGGALPLDVARTYCERHYGQRFWRLVL